MKNKELFKVVELFDDNVAPQKQKLRFLSDQFYSEDEELLGLAIILDEVTGVLDKFDTAIHDLHTAQREQEQERENAKERELLSPAALSEYPFLKEVFSIANEGVMEGHSSHVLPLRIMKTMSSELIKMSDKELLPYVSKKIREEANFMLELIEEKAPETELADKESGA